MSSPPVCPSCGQPLRQYQQMTSHPDRALMLADCWTPGCKLYAVTLTVGDHAKLTPEQIDAYGRVNARFRP